MFKRLLKRSPTPFNKLGPLGVLVVSPSGRTNLGAGFAIV